MSSLTPSRRTVLRTAAWSAPVVAVATAAPAFATSGPTFTRITTPAMPFDVTYLLFGSPVSLGTWTVALTTDVPVNLPVGTVVPAPPITAVITVPDSARATINSLNVQEISGTADAPYTVQGQAAPLDASVTVPVTTIPATTGPISITTTGTGTGFTAGSAGTFTISMENIVSNLTLSPPPLGITNITATLAKQAGEDYTFATFTVA